MSVEIIGRGWTFPIQIDPHGGMALTDVNSEIRESIRLILSTVPGERVMRPTFGCRLHELAFAPNDLETATLAKRLVHEALGMWEPRINVLDITTEFNFTHDSCLLIHIQYEIKLTHDQRSLVYPFYLIQDE